jgi:haloacetate dehalogenase
MRWSPPKLDVSLLPARDQALFPGLQGRRVPVGDGVDVHALVGGSGPLLLLLHGHPQTRATWHRVALRLARTHTVVLPFLARRDALA